jgi:hypothetical protein
VVDRVLAVEDDGRVFADMNASFPELGDRDTYDVKKFEEGKVNVVLVDKISVGRFLQIGGYRLRNQDFFNLHVLY